MTLVQIAINTHKQWPGAPPITDTLKQAQKRPKELTELIDAISRMFGRIGMHSVCSLCFNKQPIHSSISYLLRSKANRNYAKRNPSWLARGDGHGCCGSCPLLGHSRCLAKPVGCARFMCGTTSRLWPDTRSFLGFLYELTLTDGCYTSAIEREAEKTYTDVQLRQLRVARHAVDAWEAL